MSALWRLSGFMRVYLKRIKRRPRGIGQHFEGLRLVAVLMVWIALNLAFVRVGGLGGGLTLVIFYARENFQGLFSR
jgi:hypothetical protein